ncbi:hypothetical protein ISN44_Un79g000030 [Arabidopsis suecica]|uniref:Uncharacterized protein n=1 Tax=Arabidopsis suecica TaxID=45249 RepID=A0A8T1XDS9_ARASU|nr:hypothetical protein ISN44_Un79g000030 [Arabidopsis suecica]
MSDLEDSQNKSNHSYGNDESSSKTGSAASPPQVQRRVITLSGMGQIRPPSTRADKPKKKKAPKQKGGTLMTNNDLVDLQRRCQVPVGVTMILPRPSLHPKNVPAGWCCAYANFFEKCGLFFPIPACILEMLYCLDLAFTKMCPNFVRHLCQVKTNARSDQGTYYISARPGSLVLGSLKACRDTNWRSKYFFFRVDRHSIGSFDPARMTRTWSTNLTRNKEVTLSETELELLTLLRLGQTDWATFSRDSIVAALAVAPAVPAIVLPATQQDPRGRPAYNSTSDLPLISRGRMRRPSLRVQRANTGAPARAGDLLAPVTAARNSLAISSTSASASHPSLPEFNTGTSVTGGQADNNQVAQVSEPSAAVHSDGAPSSPKRARTQPEVRPAAELIVIDQEVASPREERAEPAAAIPEAAMSADRRSSGRSQGGGRGSRGGVRSSFQGLNRYQEVRQSSNSGGGSAGSRPFHWSYTHDCDHPIVEDEAGLANLLRHIKGKNSQIPGVKNMAEAAAYADMMVKEGQAIATTNKQVALYEQRLSKVPSASELKEGKTLIQELTTSVKAGQEREVSFHAEIEMLKMELSTLKDLEKGYAEKIGLMEMAIWGLQGAKKMVHDAKVGLATAYSRLLAGIKEKWVAKKEYTVLEGQAAEVESNLALIDQITKAAIDLTVERPRLQVELDDLEAQCKSKEVSEMSVVRPMDVDKQGTPIGLDEFGSNKDAFPGCLAEGSGTVFAMLAGELKE